MALSPSAQPADASAVPAQDRIPPEGQARRLGRAMALLVAIFLIVQHLSFIPVLLDAAQFGRTGLRLEGWDASGFQTVARVSPDTPAARAGVRKGDQVRFDNGFDATRSREPRPGETFSVTVRREDDEQRISLTAQAQSWTGGDRALQVSDILLSISAMIAIAVGAFAVLRSRNRLDVLLLGAALIFSNAWGSPIAFWMNDRAAYPLLNLGLQFIYAVPPLLLLGFAARFRQATTGRLEPWLRALLAGMTVACLSSFIGDSGPQLTNSGSSWAGPLRLIVGFAGPILAFFCLFLGWRETEGADRGRFSIMMPALIMATSSPLLSEMVTLSGWGWRPSNPWVLASIVVPLAGLILLVYAVLRHRVIDLGFAINRTLVYGVLSTVLLLAFGMAEWGVEKLLPKEAHEANALVGAGIALVIFLTFHHVRDWVEKAIEHLFFRAWREKEAALARFLKQAAFVTQSDALRAASVAAFRRYADEADVALYAAEPGGYVREEGRVADAPDRFELDEEPMVRLRAEREAFDDGLPLGSMQILPMLHRNEITGFFLFGLKASREVFRPDERKLLADAAIKIGLDLHALRVEALEAESHEQRLRADVLEQQLQRGLSAAER